MKDVKPSLIKWMEEINGPMEVGTPTSLTNKIKGLRRNWKETHYDSVNDLTLKKNS